MTWGLGSGKKEFYRNYDFFQYGRNKNTSRNVVHCFISTLKCINDPYCGGAPQIVGILLPPSHSVIQKALYNVTQARVMSGKRHSKMSRKQKLPGKQKR